MSYADATDPLVNALRTLLAERVPALLVPLIGNDDDPKVYDADNPSPVASTYGMPMPMALAPTLRLPALFAFRGASAWRTIGTRDHLMTEVVLSYVMPTTPAHTLESWWPLLRCVFKATIDAIVEDTLADNSHPLDAAGVIEFEEERTTVSYRFVSDAGHANAYPSFEARLFFTHTDTLPVATPVVLEDLVALDGTVIKHPEEVVLVEFSSDAEEA